MAYRSQCMHCPRGIRPNKGSLAHLCPPGSSGVPPNVTKSPACCTARFIGLVLHLVDHSRVYNNINRQFVIKSYVVFNVVEILDHLRSLFAVKMGDRLGRTPASHVDCLTRCSGPYSSPATSVALQAVVVLKFMVVDFVFDRIYVVIHAALLLTYSRMWGAWISISGSSGTIWPSSPTYPCPNFEH